MSRYIRSSGINFFGLLLITFLISFFYYRTLNLLTFINTSFTISSILIFIALFVFITQKGFFDGITYGFRRLFATKQALKEMEDDVASMRPPSQLLEPVRLSPVLTGAILLFLSMIISLYFFYNS